jgi:hypothetical protein
MCVCMSNREWLLPAKITRLLSFNPSVLFHKKGKNKKKRSNFFVLITLLYMIQRLFIVFLLYKEFTSKIFPLILFFLIYNIIISLLVNVYICYLCNSNGKHFPWRLPSSAVFLLFFFGDRCNVDLFDLCVGKGRERESERDTFCHSKPFISRRNVGLLYRLIWPSNAHIQKKRHLFGVEVVENCTVDAYEWTYKLTIGSRKTLEKENTDTPALKEREK